MIPNVGHHTLQRRQSSKLSSLTYLQLETEQELRIGGNLITAATDTVPDELIDAYDDRAFLCASH